MLNVEMNICIITHSKWQSQPQHGRKHLYAAQRYELEN